MARISTAYRAQCRKRPYQAEHGEGAQSSANYTHECGRPGSWRLPTVACAFLEQGAYDWIKHSPVSNQDYSIFVKSSRLPELWGRGNFWPTHFFPSEPNFATAFDVMPTKQATNTRGNFKLNHGALPRIYMLALMVLDRCYFIADPTGM